MHELELSKAYTLIEPGPVVLVTTRRAGRDNIMTISWTTVLDFTPLLAIVTGAWNHSYAALREQRECVIAVPGIDLLDQVVGIGTCSGADTDKFARFHLGAVPAARVQAPLIAECLAHIECKVTDFIEPYGVVVLEGVAAWVDAQRAQRRTIHAVGDGSFVADGRRYQRREAMAAKLPPGV